jgi:hypothetical protein
VVHFSLLIVISRRGDRSSLFFLTVIVTAMLRYVVGNSVALFIAARRRFNSRAASRFCCSECSVILLRGNAIEKTQNRQLESAESQNVIVSQTQSQTRRLGIRADRAIAGEKFSRVNGYVTVQRASLVLVGARSGACYALLRTRQERQIA